MPAPDFGVFDEGFMPVLCCEMHNGLFQTKVIHASRRYIVYQTVRAGGMGIGPDSFDVLSASLGACTSMTARHCANRHQWPLHKIHVAATHHVDSKTGAVEFQRTIDLIGALDDDQTAELCKVVDLSPVLKLINAKVVTRFGPISNPVEKARQEQISHFITLEQGLRAS